jgi:hypothetical protein
MKECNVLTGSQGHTCRMLNARAWQSPASHLLRRSHYRSAEKLRNVTTMAHATTVNFSKYQGLGNDFILVSSTPLIVPWDVGQGSNLATSVVMYCYCDELPVCRPHLREDTLLPTLGEVLWEVWGGEALGSPFDYLTIFCSIMNVRGPIIWDELNNSSGH